MIVYGRNAVREAIRGPRAVWRVWATKNALREPWLGPGSSVRVSIEAGEAIAAMCGSESHQGVCADVEDFRYADAGGLLVAGAGATRSPRAPAAADATHRALLVVLDQVQDPQNLGAICRSAECAGATGIVLPERRSAAVTPAVCKASAGAVEHLPIGLVRNLADFIAAAKEAGFWCYGAAPDGVLDYRSVEWGDRVLLVLGSEGKGLRPRVGASCDAIVSLPVRGEVASLSVSAAAAVLLYAASAGGGG